MLESSINTSEKSEGRTASAKDYTEDTLKELVLVERIFPSKNILFT